VTATPEQLHQALLYCIDFARVMLEDSGEFYPFGAMINSAGQVEARGAWMGEEHPNSVDVYTLLVDRLHGQLKAGRALAIAVAANVNIPEQYSAIYKDGLRVTLESRGYSRFIYVPYQLVRSGVFGRRKAAEFAEPFSVVLNPTA
jgi:hypothetical protein